MHKNNLSDKLAHLGDNEGPDELIQIPLDTHSPHSKDVHVSMSTCPDTDTDHQNAPSISVKFRNSTGSKPLYSLSPDPSMTTVEIQSLAIHH